MIKIRHELFKSAIHLFLSILLVLQLSIPFLNLKMLKYCVKLHIFRDSKWITIFLLFVSLSKINKNLLAMGENPQHLKRAILIFWPVHYLLSAMSSCEEKLLWQTTNAHSKLHVKWSQTKMHIGSVIVISPLVWRIHSCELEIWKLMAILKIICLAFFSSKEICLIVVYESPCKSPGFPCLEIKTVIVEEVKKWQHRQHLYKWDIEDLTNSR